MKPRYVHLQPELPPPGLEARLYLAVIIADQAVGEAWRGHIAAWLVASGCLYVVAWGVDCEKWHDSVDWATLEAFDFGDIPDERFVMTTWHANEPLSEACWFAGNCADHPDVELAEMLIVHIAREPQAAEMLKAYAVAQFRLT